MPAISFDNPFGIYAFASVAFLILLYLIRPKLQDLKIPSIMFLMQDEDKARKSTFFRRFISSLLFFLQLLALTLLSAAILSPTIQVDYDSTAENTVIILDVSASMKAGGAGSTRFDKALDIASGNIRGSTSIILAENRPLVALEAGSEAKARDILSVLKPKDTRSNIGDAILLAGELLKSNEGRVLVISDFLATDGADPSVAKKVLEQRGVVVDLVSVKGGSSNAGIIDVKVTARDTRVVVKNYDAEDKTLRLEVKNEKGFSHVFPLKVLARSVEPLAFDTMPGATTVRLLEQDDLSSDNTLYLMNPLSSSVTALLISNNPNLFLKNALESGGIDVVTASPPIMPDMGKFGLIVLERFDKGKLLPGTMGEIKQLVENGKPLIITLQNETDKVDYQGLLPFMPSGIGKEAAVTKSVENQFTKDVDFGQTDFYAKGKELDSSVVIARMSDSSPAIAYHDVGDGKVLYYGIDDDSSGFKGSTSYPIFWTSLASFMLGMESIDNFNHKTGSVLAFENERVIETPKGKVATAMLIMEDAGVYAIQGQFHTANLLSDAESDIARDTAVTTTQSDKYAPVSVKRKKEVGLAWYLAIAAFALMAVELAYSKYRGDF